MSFNLIEQDDSWKHLKRRAKGKHPWVGTLTEKMMDVDAVACFARPCADRVAKSSGLGCELGSDRLLVALQNTSYDHIEVVVEVVVTGVKCRWDVVQNGSLCSVVMTTVPPWVNHIFFPRPRVHPVEFVINPQGAADDHCDVTLKIGIVPSNFRKRRSGGSAPRLSDCDEVGTILLYCRRAAA